MARALTSKAACSTALPCETWPIASSTSPHPPRRGTSNPPAWASSDRTPTERKTGANFILAALRDRLLARPLPLLESQQHDEHIAAAAASGGAERRRQGRLFARWRDHAAHRREA